MKGNNSKNFTGNVYLFYSFDISDDINLEEIRKKNILDRKLFTPSKYFKNYHIPLSFELSGPKNDINKHCVSAKLHNFGVISLVYKVPFKRTFEELRREIDNIEHLHSEQAILDAGIVFKKIKDYLKQPKFFHLRNSYVIIQVNQEYDEADIVKFKEDYGSMIASILRFETETLSEYQKNDILNSAIGYYRGDLIIVDTEAAFVYDDEYEEYLDFFEFANIHQLELQYFDRVLDQQLNSVYKGEFKKLPLKAYMPLIGSSISDPVDDLAKLRVDISVITEQLESSIKILGEAFYSELYHLLMQKLEIFKWKESINKKLSIALDIRHEYHNKIATIKDDLLTMLIIALIGVELIFGILSYFK